mgnify:CR=1 FL=1
MWFYDMKADGFSLDDKRVVVSENDITDIIKRFKNRCLLYTSDAADEL